MKDTYYKKSLIILLTLTLLGSCINPYFCRELEKVTDIPLIDNIQPEAKSEVLEPIPQDESDNSDDEQYKKKNETKEKEDKKKSLEEKLKTIKEESSRVKKEIEKTKKKKNSKLAKKKDLNTQVGNTKQEIVSLSQKITSLSQKISKKENEVSNKESEISVARDLLKSRIKFNYMTPELSKLEAVMNMGKYSDYLCRLEYQAKISDNDQKKLNELKETLTQIQQTKKEIEQNKYQIEITKEKVETKKKQLENELVDISNEVYSIEKEEAAWHKNAENLKKQMNALQAEIEKICRELASDTEYVGGDMIWPVPGCFSISSPFGPRSFDGFHYGVDISQRGIYGKNVVATNSGKIIFAGWRSLYGICVIIDHGGKRTSLYAHLSSTCVSLNQTVTKGQTIGLVGSTGNSTGPHLHFEIRENGKAKNPMIYFKKAKAQ